MSAVISLIGLVFVISGILSIAKITEVGLNFIELSRIHTLPFLNTFPAVWVYIVLGLILIAIAAGISRR